MKRAWLVLVLAVMLGSPVSATEPVTRTVNAPLARTWATAEAVLKQLGWDIDKADRTIGWITTESRSVDSEDYGVYAKGIRHRLQIRMKAAGESRTSITVERALFKRERILWVDKDEPLSTTDQTVEKAVLSAIEKSL